MTPKFIAVKTDQGRVITPEGTVYERLYRAHRQYHPEVGDVAFLGKRLQNQHHGQPEYWELWPITIVCAEIKGVKYTSYPKLWYGGGRYIFVRA